MEGKTDVFAFVVMPNHIHLIWRLKELNGKEKPHTSFLKFTAHRFRRILADSENLSPFYVGAANKQYKFWQRDSLAVWIFSRKVAYQKLNYIHNNPLRERWNLCRRPEDYFYSSASYYEKELDRFRFLKDIRAEY